MVEISKKIFKEFLETVSILGSIYLAPILIILYSIILEFNLKLILGFILLILTGMIIRLALFKERPNKEEHSNKLEKIKASSLPSMHSAIISYLGFFFLVQINKIEFTIFIISIIVLVSLSRYILKKHYLIDIISGLFLGTIIFLISNILM